MVESPQRIWIEADDECPYFSGAPMHSLPCSKCGGEGSLYTSRYGGNDPDVWRVGTCEACEGSGNQTCEARGCKEPAIGLNDDGEALCEDCLLEWQIASDMEDF